MHRGQLRQVPQQWGGEPPGIVEALALERLLRLRQPLDETGRVTAVAGRGPNRRGRLRVDAAPSPGWTAGGHRGSGPTGRAGRLRPQRPLVDPLLQRPALDREPLGVRIPRRARSPRPAHLGRPPLGRGRGSRRPALGPPVRPVAAPVALPGRLRARRTPARRDGAPDGKTEPEDMDPNATGAPPSRGGRKRRGAPTEFGGRSSSEIRRRPTLPGGEPPSTIGAGRLNFRVRDGNGCDSAAMATEISCQRARRTRGLQSKHERQLAFNPSPRPISTGRLNTLLCVHLRPINVMVLSRALLR